MKPVRITFRTDGWRRVIADDFTFERVRVVAAALADVLDEQGAAGKQIVVGWAWDIGGRQRAHRPADHKEFFCTLAHGVPLMHTPPTSSGS